jgi:hypothetical protein
MAQGNHNRALIALTVVLLVISSAADAKQWKRHPPAQTQSDCIVAYLAVCGSVPLIEASIRACVSKHQFSPECLELAKGLK